VIRFANIGAENIQPVRLMLVILILLCCGIGFAQPVELRTDRNSLSKNSSLKTFSL